MPGPVLDLEPASELIDTEDGPALRGGRCVSGGTLAFPVPGRACGHGAWEPDPAQRDQSSRLSASRSGIASPL